MSLREAEFAKGADIATEQSPVAGIRYSARIAESEKRRKRQPGSQLDGAIPQPLTPLIKSVFGN